MTEDLKTNAISIDFVQDIIDYIEENLLEELSPIHIAEQFYISVSTLNIMLRIVCNISIMEYIRNRRLSLAGKELFTSNIHVIDLAFKYGYETPEAFTKAFTRFHGFPPSFVRRAYPELKVFHPLQIKIEIHGGWENVPNMTNQSFPKQEQNLLYCYDNDKKNKGVTTMEKIRKEYHINIDNMEQKEDWRVLRLLTQKLDECEIKFKVDGKTMIFAHGLEFKVEKICLTFKWNEEKQILHFFGYQGTAKNSKKGFKYFDTMFEGMKVRCLFYGDCPGDDTDEFLYRNTDSVDVDGQIFYVQSLEFYYENAEPKDENYNMVEEYLKQS